MSRSLFCLVVLTCIIAAGLASPATQLPCEVATPLCAVSNVDITPCADKKSCRFRRGRNATINFDFTPEFQATELETTVSYQRVAFSGLERNACLFTACPVTKGVGQSLSYNLYINKKLPVGSYDIEWKVWNKEDATQVCCFKTKIEIKK